MKLASKKRLYIVIMSCVYLYSYLNEEDETTQEEVLLSILEEKHVLKFPLFHPENHPKNETLQKIGKRFEERKKILDRICSLVNLTWAENFNRIVYAAKYNMFGCLVAKNGATTLRMHFTKMNHFKLPDEADEVLYFNNQIFAHNQISNKRKLRRMLTDQSTIKVLVARHPLVRLAACFRDKMNEGVLEKSTLNKIKSNFFKLAESTLGVDLGNKTHWKIGFEEFLKFAIKNIQDEEEKVVAKLFFDTVDNKKTDIHLRPIHSSCNVCRTEYTYICHHDTYDQDLDYVFKTHHISETETGYKYFEKNDTPAYKDLEFYQKVSPTTLKSVVTLVKNDMHLFGYEIPTFIQQRIRY